MEEWIQRKLVEQACQRENEMLKKEQERLERATKKEKGNHIFKQWLKGSLINLREQMI